MSRASTTPTRTGASSRRRLAIAAGVGALCLGLAVANVIVERAPGSRTALGTLKLAPRPASPGPSGPSPAVPASGAYFGAYVGDSTGRTLEETEALLGRRLAIVHDYRRWDHAPLLKPEHEEWAAGGRIVFLNWNAKTDAGEAVPWAQIANGSEDARIDAAAEEAKRFARPLFIAFHHE